MSHVLIALEHLIQGYFKKIRPERKVKSSECHGIMTWSVKTDFTLKFSTHLCILSDNLCTLVWGEPCNTEVRVYCLAIPESGYKSSRAGGKV